MRPLLLMLSLLTSIAAFSPNVARACSFFPTLTNTIVAPAAGATAPSNAKVYALSSGTACPAASAAFELVNRDTAEAVAVTWTNRELRNTRFIALPTTFLLWEGTPTAPLAAGSYVFRALDYTSPVGCDESTDAEEVVFTVGADADTAAPEAPMLGAATPNCRFEMFGTSCDVGAFPRWRQRLEVTFSAADVSHYEVTVDGQLEYAGAEPMFTLQRLEETTLAMVEVRAVDLAGNASTAAFLRVNESCDPTSGPRCGDGTVDAGEECDLGPLNSDAPGAECRSNCRDAGCGDGVTDPEEGCDDGEGNADAPDRCRTDCSAPDCGDGILDTDEACDDGDDNSDAIADACRTTCELASCGDGVVDDGEACDPEADGVACRDDCTESLCGDGVVDDGEECDHGADNSDTDPDACRTTCVSPSCGDGVVDTGETCDVDSVGCDPMCQVVEMDAGTDAGSDGGTDAGEDTGTRDAGTDAGEPAPIDDGCGCAVPGAQSGSPIAALLFAAFVFTRRRQRA